MSSTNYAQSSNNWVGKVYTISGTWEITNDNKLVLAENFKTPSGPDLKLYLTKNPMSEISDRDKKSDDWLYFGELTSSNGAQSYSLPEDIDLSEYKSVIIHCTAYAVVWGGFDFDSH